MAKQAQQPKGEDEEFAPAVQEPEDEAEGGAEDKEEGDKAENVRIKPDEDGGVTVELPKTRRAKRGERVSRYTDEVKKLREENERVNRHLAELTQQITRQAQPQSYQPPAQRQDADPYQQELDHIRAEQETIQTALRAGTIQDGAQIERARQRFYALDSRARQLDRDKIKRELTEELRREMGAREGEHEEAVLKAEFPDVIAHPQAMQYARGEYYRLLAKGEPPFLATYRKALTAAAEEFALRQRRMPEVPVSQQQRYGAVPQQAGTKGTPGGIRLSQTDMKIAKARWPEDDDHVAYAKMAALLKKAGEEKVSDE